MIFHGDWFFTFSIMENGLIVDIKDEMLHEVKGVGAIIIEMHSREIKRIENIWFELSIIHNWLSVGKIIEKEGMNIIFYENIDIFKSYENKWIAKGIKKGIIYQLNATHEE